MSDLTPTEYARQMAQQEPPLTDEQVETVARILAATDVEVAA